MRFTPLVMAPEPAVVVELGALRLQIGPDVAPELFSGLLVLCEKDLIDLRQEGGGGHACQTDR